ncbi:uncharacterized protein TNCV_2620161 [Trichonephila clavipes]|uniref:Uncharacterized protein n=1 Tax=Trichonephila clavipes TaxID=2585209 RepID=A0A8X7BIP6_TRICX|nr:uncharacterized protein TNCV_2620161 [Trichonephila clavipes]
MDPSLLCQGKGLVLPNLSIDETAQRVRFLLISLPNNALSIKSPFTIHKALKGISGEPKSVKRLRSGDLLVETSSSTQTKYFLLAKTFLDSPVNIIPHKSLNTSRGVISETDLLTTSEAEILEGFSHQGVIQVRRITIKKDTTIIPTKHLILTFSSPIHSESSALFQVSEVRTLTNSLSCAIDVLQTCICWTFFRRLQSSRNASIVHSLIPLTPNSVLNGKLKKKFKP